MASTVLLTRTARIANSPQWMTSFRCRSTAALASHEGVGHARPFEEMPGPKPMPIIGNVWRFLPGIGEYNIKDTVGTQKKLREKYGDIIRLSGIPGKPAMVFTFNPADTEVMFRNEGQWPMRPASESFAYYYKNLKVDVTGGNTPLFSGNGKEWQTLRSTVQQPIMQPRTARMYISSVEQVADEFMQRIRELRDNKNEMPNDFHNHLFKWSLESIAIIALDTRLGCLSPHLSADSEPQQMIDAVQDLFHVFPKLEFGIPLWKYYKTSSWRTFEKSMDTFINSAVKYINRAVEKLKNLPDSSEEDLTLIQRLLKRDPNPQISLLTALDLLLAGIDTTSISSANFLYLLAKNPDKQQKLFEEISEILPTKETPVTSERLNDMKYLRACMKEAMRVGPVAAGNARITPTDIVLSGYNVPKGSIILSGGVLMSVDSKNYPMADKYIPERWLRDDDAECPFTKEDQKTHPFTTMPFGYGPRMCIGRRFAEMEIQMLVLKAIQNFEVQFNYETTFSTAERIMYTILGPMKFTFNDRK